MLSLRNLRLLLAQHKLDSLYLPLTGNNAHAHLHYLTDLPLEVSNGHVFYKKNSARPTVFLSHLEIDNAPRSPRFVAKAISREPEKWDAQIRNHIGKRTGTVLSAWPADALKRFQKKFPHTRLTDLSAELGARRALKSDDEIKRIKRAIRITQSVLDNVPDWHVQKMTERELAVKITAEFLRQGDYATAFPTIVASRAHAGVPHHVPDHTRIKPGWLLIDCGARYRNYCADLTRTFFLGTPSAKQKALYESVFQVRQEAADQIRINRPYAEIFDWAKNRIHRLTAMPLIHGLGHGLGLDVHDFPRGFLKTSKEKVAANHVLTVEPGVYGKWGGIRIEDDGIVAKNGFKFLSRAQEKLETL